GTPRADMATIRSVQLPDIAGSIELLAGRNAPFALATVVGVRGSAYRRAGARAVLPEGGDPIGSLSPGCLEMELLDVARSVAESARPELQEFDLTGEDEIELGYGMGCQGVVEVFLEPPDSAEGFARLMRQVAEERRTQARVMLIEGPRTGTGLAFTMNGTTSASVDGIENAVEAARNVMRSGTPS